ncbi:MAG TPA: transcription antitermination factor NusB [Acidimicrobiales bacterium]|jgi:16S rRNA (cytosine967-C5)-methyltransferase
MANPEHGASARRLALSVLARIDDDGAYANIVLGHALGAASLDRRDRGLVTELVYGVTRMRRSLDWMADRHVLEEPDRRARRLLRLGAYQLAYLTSIPAHAAVDETVGLAPRRLRGFVNAILRRIAADIPIPDEAWPSPAVRWSLPDHVWSWLERDLGEDAAPVAATMSLSPEVTVRDDGYRQDRGSARVVEAMAFAPGDRVLDLCAAPGGKATDLAGRGARVVASDISVARSGLIAKNLRAMGASGVEPVAADGTAPPFRPRLADVVLVDAPCSGLGVLRRRADARWRIGPDAPERLGRTQQRLLASAAELVRPGGSLTYSVCTMTAEETLAIDDWSRQRLPEWSAASAPPAPWQRHGRGALLLPHVEGTDGMFLLTLNAPL